MCLDGSVVVVGAVVVVVVEVVVGATVVVVVGAVVVVVVEVVVDASIVVVVVGAVVVVVVVVGTAVVVDGLAVVVAGSSCAPQATTAKARKAVTSLYRITCLSLAGAGFDYYCGCQHVVPALAGLFEYGGEENQEVG